VILGSSLDSHSIAPHHSRCQAFQSDVIRRAYASATDDELDNGTECLALAMRYGGCRVKLIDGDADRLWKVTYQHDLFAAEQLVKKDLRQVTPHVTLPQQ
jgi:2-C-methyl-D-erythritol 4-phosphate cytidylyltransferase